jgi:hypothetical protein
MANKGATRAVIRNLDTDFKDTSGVKSFRNGPVVDHLNRDRERFERDAKEYLGDKSNLRSVTLESADWDEVYHAFYPVEVAEVIEAIAAHQSNALRAAVLETLRALHDNLITASQNAHTDNSRLELMFAATMTWQAREYLKRGVNGNANVCLEQAHRRLTPLRTRASLAAIKNIKALGLV